jgi:hypothetical protein
MSTGASFEALQRTTQLNFGDLTLILLCDTMILPYALPEDGAVIDVHGRKRAEGEAYICVCIQWCCRSFLTVGRCDGFFVRAAWMKFAAAAGSHAGILGAAERMALMEPSRVLMPNGGQPTKSSYASTPQAHASTRAP